MPVRRQVALNRVLREAGLLAVREVSGGEYLYPGDCRAFAMVDNQVAHIYFPRTSDLEAEVRKVRQLLAGVDGVAEVLDRPALAARGLDHVRSGELVVLAQPDAHFVYYWWLDDAKAPPMARTVDIHGKPGFDAAELLIDMPAARIPTTAEGIRGSHGLVPDDGRGLGRFRRLGHAEGTRRPQGDPRRRGGPSADVRVHQQKRAVGLRPTASPHSVAFINGGAEKAALGPWSEGKAEHHDGQEERENFC